MLNYLIESTRDYRSRYGQLRGVLFWLQARQDYKLSPGTEYAVSVPDLAHPVFLRASSSDLLTLQQVLVGRETDFDLWYEPKFIIDAGANIGLTSVALASRYPSCRIVALEIEDANFAQLVRNTEKYPNIVPKKIALWSEHGFVRITNPAAAAWAFQVEKASQDVPGAIPTTTIARLLEEFNEPQLSLLKLDIEGAEKQVLSEGDLAWVERTSTMAVELHDRFRPGCTAALEALLAGRKFSRDVRGEYRVVHFQH